MYICIYMYICVFCSVRGPHIRVGTHICHLIDPSHAQFHSFHRLLCCGRTAARQPATFVVCLFVCHLFVFWLFLFVLFYCFLFVCFCFVCFCFVCFEFFSFFFLFRYFCYFLQGMRACVFVCYARAYCVYSRCVCVHLLCPYRVSVSCAWGC